MMNSQMPLSVSFLCGDCRMAIVMRAMYEYGGLTCAEDGDDFLFCSDGDDGADSSSWTLLEFAEACDASARCWVKCRWNSAMLPPRALSNVGDESSGSSESTLMSGSESSESPLADSLQMTPGLMGADAECPPRKSRGDSTGEECRAAVAPIIGTDRAPGVVGAVGDVTVSRIIVDVFCRSR